ncbi:efflux RND transporter periplasmic adaptor subunit [Stenotrophomonas sp. MMGLT7]|uniref:efflux RND transporter periplasmic adaptor subunit n=1 Tax=Stenotrophomonas sp. MMGLT7 TaxID=2901227 RepID=UPI001E5869A7|nr:efflux RND transporter periplasmic adaptor subunit [Stenotrophomonas sp. MMGLT7]MCD7097741.1 efflux RND transporter periplasmic adaptor subunit [Stenotrophomonas sp. MMGLT7]
MKTSTIAAAVLAVLTALAAGFLLGRHHPVPAPAKDAAGAQREVLYWYDPMMPAQHFDKPGKSPFMDMQLVPRYADEASAADDAVRISPALSQSLGVRTVAVRRGALARRLQVPGTLAWDPTREQVVSVRTDAVVERLYARTPFAKVRAGQPLASLLAPEWSGALAEAQALAAADSAPARELRAAAQRRLAALGLPPGARVRGGRIAIAAPADGVLTEIGVREGELAAAGTLMFRINGNAGVWLEAALPQADSAGIGPGSVARVRVDAWPGEVFDGRVQALLPQVDAATRSRRARIVLDNADGRLAAGMFAEVELEATPAAAQLLVPSEALIEGQGPARVIVADGEGRFRPVAVRAGRSGGGMTEILAGLREGEQVVASGQFLIDSEASLSGALERLGSVGDDVVADGASAGGTGGAGIAEDMPQAQPHRHDRGHAPAAEPVPAGHEHAAHAHAADAASAEPQP